MASPDENACTRARATRAAGTPAVLAARAQQPPSPPRLTASERVALAVQYATAEAAQRPSAALAADGTNGEWSIGFDECWREAADMEALYMFGGFRNCSFGLLAITLAR